MKSIRMNFCSIFLFNLCFNTDFGLELFSLLDDVGVCSDARIINLYAWVKFLGIYGLWTLLNLLVSSCFVAGSVELFCCLILDKSWHLAALVHAFTI